MNRRPRHRGRPMRAPHRFAALVGYTVRACVPSRRRWALLAPAAGAVLLGVLATLGDGDRSEIFAQVASLGLFSLVLPLACLVLGDAVLGAEVRSGTFAFTWLSPTPFRVIVLARWLGAWLVALVVLVPAGALSATVAGVPGASTAMALAMATGSAAYVAVFVAVGAATTRAAVWSIALVVLVERLLGTALSSIAQLSPLWLARGVYGGLAPGASETLERGGVPDGMDAVARLALVTAVALVVATARLARLRLAGAED